MQLNRDNMEIQVAAVSDNGRAVVSVTTRSSRGAAELDFTRTMRSASGLAPDPSKIGYALW